MQVLIGTLALLVVCLIFLLMIDAKEAYVDAPSDEDYTQKYTKQIEDYLNAEEKEIQGTVRVVSDPKFITWKTDVDKTSISKRMEALPSPSAYMDALKKTNKEVDIKLIDEDVDSNAINKINSATSLDELGLDKSRQENLKKAKDDFKKVVDAITLSSLSKFKERALEVAKIQDDVYLIFFKIMLKGELLRSGPTTADGFIKYEIEKFAIPFWKPLQFALGRLAKIMSIGPDGKQKYNDNEAMGLAIKDLSEKTKVSDLDKFYTLMSVTKGTPQATAETLDKLFSDPMSYLNLLIYMGGKMKELTGKTGSVGEGFAGDLLFSNPRTGDNQSEGFFGSLLEGWEDVKKGAKCVPCKIEPEVQDIEGLKKRYTILKTSRKQFKEELAKLVKGQAKIEEIEKKAMSGELMTEMIANRKIE